MTDTVGLTRASSNTAAFALYRWLIGLFAVGVLVQVFLAGFGVFGIDQKKLEDATSLDPHRAVGTLLALIALLAAIAAAVAKAGRKHWGGALILLVLTFVVQSLFAGLGEDNKLFGGLHALDGMVILLYGTWLALSVWRPATRL